MDNYNQSNPFECPCCRTFYDENTIPCTLHCGHSMCITHAPMHSECLICKEPFPNGNNPDSFVPSVALAAGAIQYRNTFNVMSDLINRQAMSSRPPPVAKANAQQQSNASASRTSSNGSQSSGNKEDAAASTAHKTQNVAKLLAASKNSSSGSLRDCVADEVSACAEPDAATVATAAAFFGDDDNVEGTLQYKTATGSVLHSSSAAAIPASAPGPSPEFTKLNFKTVTGAMQAQEGDEIEASGVFSSADLMRQASNSLLTSSTNNPSLNEASVTRNSRSSSGINNTNASSASTAATHIIPPAAQASASASAAQDAAQQKEEWYMSTSTNSSGGSDSGSGSGIVTTSRTSTRNSTSGGFGSSIFNSMKSVISGPAAASASAQAQASDPPLNDSVTKSMAVRALPAASASASASAAAAADSSCTADESEPFSNLERTGAFNSSSVAKLPPPPAASAPPAELFHAMRDFNTLMLSNTTSNGVDLESVVQQVLANQQQQQQPPVASAAAAAPPHDTAASAAAPPSDLKQSQPRGVAMSMKTSSTSIAAAVAAATSAASASASAASHSSQPSKESMKMKNLGDDSDLCDNSISFSNSWKSGGGLLDEISDKSLNK